MVHRINWIVLSPLLIVIGLGALWYCRRVFDATPPQVTVEGMVDGGTYAGEIACVVRGKDNYRVGDISLCLDDVPLVNQYRINRKHFEQAFPISAQALPQGNHQLKIMVRDASSKKNESVQVLDFAVDNLPLEAAFVKTDDLNVYQGRTLHVQFQVNKPIEQAVIEVLSKTFPCVPESSNSLIYECFVPIKCDENPSEHLLNIKATDKVGNTIGLKKKFRVVMYPFKKQRLYVNSQTVREEAAQGRPEVALEVDLEEISRQSPSYKLWTGPFYVPCDMKGISTEFGTERTTQDRGRYCHAAIDFLAPPKTVVWAAQDGVVALKDRFGHSGKTVVIDHGCGITTMYFHLDEFAPINVGDTIKKGKPVGTIGKTGYASGYHLHWEMRINNVPIDPMEWTKHDF